MSTNVIELRKAEASSPRLDFAASLESRRSVGAMRLDAPGPTAVARTVNVAPVV